MYLLKTGLSLMSATLLLWGLSGYSEENAIKSTTYEFGDTRTFDSKSHVFKKTDTWGRLVVDGKGDYRLESDGQSIIILRSDNSTFIKRLDEERGKIGCLVCNDRIVRNVCAGHNFVPEGRVLAGRAFTEEDCLRPPRIPEPEAGGIDLFVD